MAAVNADQKKPSVLPALIFGVAIGSVATLIIRAMFSGDKPPKAPIDEPPDEDDY